MSRDFFQSKPAQNITIVKPRNLWLRILSFPRIIDMSIYILRTTDTDYPLWTEIFSVTVPLEKDVRFLDWSAPENLREPVQLGFDALLDLLLADTNFSPYNTRVTFDED